MNFSGRGFDLAAHQARIEAWSPPAYPRVDIYLPICGEPIEMLRNTWTAVCGLMAAYPGPATAYVLDDGPRTRPADLAASASASTTSGGPTAAAYKKSGNLRHAFAQTSSEFILILDADFAPRPDFLAETLPYMDDPSLAIVQTPQFFRAAVRRRPGWRTPRASIQEVFYRAIQVAREQVRRRDLHRDVRDLPADRAGGARGRGAHPLRRGCAHRPQRDAGMAGPSAYVPIVLSTGMCPTTDATRSSASSTAGAPGTWASCAHAGCGRSG